ADDRRADVVVLERPGDGERHRRHPGLARDRREATRRLERALVDEASGHRLRARAVLGVAREARARRPRAVEVLAGQHAAADRAVWQEAHALAAADLGERVLEAAVQQAEVVLDRLEARQRTDVRGPQALHQPVRGLVAAADRAHLAGVDRARQRLEGLLDRQLGV